MSSLRATYLCLAILGLIVPWYFNIQSFADGGFLDFVAATVTNAASRSIVSDLLIVTTAGSIWIIVESRRLNIRYGWAFVPIGFLIAFAFAFPAFLYVRQGRLDTQPQLSPNQAGERHQ